MRRNDEPPADPKCWACGAGAEDGCRDPKKCAEDTRRMEADLADQLAEEEEMFRRYEEESS